MSEILTIWKKLKFYSVKWKSVHVLEIIVNIDNMHGKKTEKVYLYLVTTLLNVEHNTYWENDLYALLAIFVSENKPRIPNLIN